MNEKTHLGKLATFQELQKKYQNVVKRTVAQKKKKTRKYFVYAQSHYSEIMKGLKPENEITRKK